MVALGVFIIPKLSGLGMMRKLFSAPYGVVWI